MEELILLLVGAQRLDVPDGLRGGGPHELPLLPAVGAPLPDHARPLVTSLRGQGDPANVQQRSVTDHGVGDVQLLQQPAVGGDAVQDPVLRLPGQLDADQVLAGGRKVPLQRPLLPHTPAPVHDVLGVHDQASGQLVLEDHLEDDVPVLEEVIGHELDTFLCQAVIHGADEILREIFTDIF